MFFIAVKYCKDTCATCTAYSLLKNLNPQAKFDCVRPASWRLWIFLWYIFHITKCPKKTLSLKVGPDNPKPVQSTSESSPVQCFFLQLTLNICLSFSGEMVLLTQPRFHSWIFCESSFIQTCSRYFNQSLTRVQGIIKDCLACSYAFRKSL